MNEIKKNFPSHNLNAREMQHMARSLQSPHWNKGTGNKGIVFHQLKDMGIVKYWVCCNLTYFGNVKENNCCFISVFDVVGVFVIFVTLH